MAGAYSINTQHYPTNTTKQDTTPPPLHTTTKQSHDYRPEALRKEDSGYSYRYSYDGAGDSTVW